MRFYIVVLVLAAVVLVECGHTFLGTNVLRPMVYHHDAQFSSKIFRKRVENIYFKLPTQYITQGQAIRGILAYDLTHSAASANVTEGGIGYNFVNIRMKSESGEKLHYDIYIYT